MLSKEHEQIVEDALEIIKSSAPGLTVEREIAKAIMDRIIADDTSCETTREFLSRVRGMDLTAKRISAKFPTIYELCTADYDSIRATNRVGDRILCKVYDALLEAGYEPDWKPICYKH